MHIVERRLVSCKYTICIRIFLHCLGCCIPVRLVIKQIPFHGQIQDFHSMLLQRLFKYDMSVICRYIRSNTSDVDDPLTVIFQHDLCCQLTTISMVRPYHRDFRTEILVQCDNCTLPVYIFLPVQCMCTGNDPIHHIAVQHIQIVAFSVAASYCVADHRLVASLVESYLRFPRKCREKRMIQIRDQDTYDTGSVTKQISCQFIWCIFQIADRLFNFFAGISSNIATAIYYSGHSTDPYSGLLCHIFDTCHIS